MSDTERNRAETEPMEDAIDAVIDADTPIDVPEDMVAEEVAILSEVETDAQPEPVAQPTSPGAGSMIIGGALAAAIGAAATLVFLPEGWRTVDTSGLERRIAAVEGMAGGLSAADLAEALAPIEGRIAALEGVELPAAVDLAPLTTRIAALEAAGLDPQALNAALAPLEARVAQIEGDLTDAARDAVNAALAEARAEIDAQAATVSTREDDVAAAQAQIAARAALAELVAAAESGDPQPGALAVLSASHDVPAAMAPFGDGLITLAGLQDAFAPAARAALDAVEPPADAPMSDRFVNFLRSQTGARSLAPRDGDDPDAVLSRAEAVLRQGDISGTLQELDALTGAPAAAMANWRGQAELRLAALAALSALQDQFTANEG